MFEKMMILSKVDRLIEALEAQAAAQAKTTAAINLQTRVLALSGQIPAAIYNGDNVLMPQAQRQLEALAKEAGR